MEKLPNPLRRLNELSVILAFIVACTSLAGAQNKPAADPKPKIPTFTVKGRIVYDNSDRPVRRAQVALVQFPDQRNGGDYTSASDREGRFTIVNVPAGIYLAFVDSPGIIAPFAFTAMSENGPSESLDLKSIKEYCTEIVVESSDVEVTIRARRGGAISGKITYADGEPAVNVDVAVIRRSGNQPSRILTGLNPVALLSLHTDDRGRYRIPGLPPGEYLVRVAEKYTSPKNKNRGYGFAFDGLFGSSDALSVTYYGGSTNIQDAVKLEVGANSELTGIDISMADVTPHTIRGSVIARLDRIPLPGATVGIRMKDNTDWNERGGRQIPTDEEGLWVAEDIPDGTYLVRVEPPGNIPVPGATPVASPTEGEEIMRDGPPVPTRKFVPSEVPIVVAGGDVVVEPIALAEGASISGTIELPAEFKQVPAVYLNLNWRYEHEPAPSYRNTTSAYGESFTIDGLREGKVYLNASLGYGLSEEDGDKYYVKSIMLNGVDILHRPISLKEGQVVTGIRIVIAGGRAHASIKLITAEGKPATARRLVVAPVDESSWLFQSDLITGATDSQGQMTFSCPPGEYLVIVSSEDVWPPTQQSIKKLSVNATRIRVSAGQNKPFVVTVP